MVRKVCDAEGVVHADGADGTDYTLCGDGEDGETGLESMRDTDERIDCGRCVRIILFAKTIGRSDYATGSGDRSAK